MSSPVRIPRMASSWRRQFDDTQLSSAPWSFLSGLVAVGAAGAAPTGVIQASGTQLLLNGSTYRFTGVNAYEAARRPRQKAPRMGTRGLPAPRRAVRGYSGNPPHQPTGPLAVDRSG